ncbi:3929_t:CDS:2, partial [Cetraspora pellucida]
MPSLPCNSSVGFDEPRLSYNILVRYLLEPGKLEGGRHYTTDYENGNGPERSFVCEQLMKVDKIKYLSKW